MEISLDLILKFPVACLAIWRISSLISGENGPWDIFKKVRAYVTLKSQPSHGRTTPREPWASISEGLHCLWCVSLWFSPFVAFWITTYIPSWVLVTFALSAGSILTDALISFLYRNRSEEKVDG